MLFSSPGQVGSCLVLSWFLILSCLALVLNLVLVLVLVLVRIVGNIYFLDCFSPNLES